MNFLNLGIGEILFILIIALIIFGPGNLVKAARDMGAFVRKVSKSPYWQEIWATRRELSELPRMIAKEAKLDETINELNRETREMKSNLASSVSDLIKEVDAPLKMDENKSTKGSDDMKVPPPTENKILPNDVTEDKE